MSNLKRCLNGLGLFALLLAVGCSAPQKEYIMVGGAAQGTTYHITYQDDQQRDYSRSIDSLLKVFDKSLSIYDSTSIISKINRNDTIVLADDWFVTVYNKADEIYQLSGGAFDMTVGPVVRAWGFSNGPVAKHDSAYIQSLLKYVGMNKVKLEGRKVKKDYPEVMLDANALAQGYSVDLICDFLAAKGVQNYLVEVGGEVRGTGRNSSGNFWRIGIDKPQDNNFSPGEDLEAVVELRNKSLATSGNYRKFYVENGVKYSHTIDPHTGYPARNTLLSATVLANDCITADALATTFMVLGVDKSKQLLGQLRDVEVYLVYNDQYGTYLTYSTPGMLELIVPQN